jgi:hypothetical protein
LFVKAQSKALRVSSRQRPFNASTAEQKNFLIAQRYQKSDKNGEIASTKFPQLMLNHCFCLDIQELVIDAHKN